MPINTNTTGTGRAAKFDNIGDRIEGVIVSAEEKPQTDIETGEIKRWSDGKPIQQWVIAVQTDLRDGDDDDGVRVLYAKGGRFDAASGSGQSMMEAIKGAASGKPIEEGGTLTVMYSGQGKKKNAAYAAPKLYKAKYAAPALKTVDLDDDFA